ncbi:MAG: aldo/keto reductase, partial [Bacteroidales bacterium]|nr:aldo/keto reductase [Bacteroidales bacterium]
PNDSGLSRKHIIEGTDAALERMGLEYVDLIFCHRPDIYTPIEETVRAMNHVVNQGKAFYWGTSEWSAEQIKEAYLIARREHLIPPLMEQPEYNMFNRQKIEMDFLPLYEEIGLGTTIWSPLASGVLTNKYAQGFPEGSRLSLKENEWLKQRFETPDGREKITKAAQLQPIAKDLNITLAQMSLAWCLKNPHVSTVITGASTVSQLEENLKALQYVDLLTPAVMEKIEAILQNKPQSPKDWRV